MKTNPLLLIPLLVANAHAADSAVLLQAQPLAPAPGSQTGVSPVAASNVVASPKIHETMATRNADGSLSVGCVERPNPRAAALSPRANTPAEAQK